MTLGWSHCPTRKRKREKHESFGENAWSQGGGRSDEQGGSQDHRGSQEKEIGGKSFTPDGRKEEKIILWSHSFIVQNSEFLIRSLINGRRESLQFWSRSCTTSWKCHLRSTKESLELQIKWQIDHGTEPSIKILWRCARDCRKGSSILVVGILNYLNSQCRSIPSNYKVLFMQGKQVQHLRNHSGGGTGQFAAVPLNLVSSTDVCDYAGTSVILPWINLSSYGKLVTKSIRRSKEVLSTSNGMQWPFERQVYLHPSSF